MKKLFTVSLVAIMAVSAAHADIASTGYVDNAISPINTKVGSVSFTAGTAAEGLTDLTSAVNAVAGAVKDVAGGSIKLTEASAGTNVSIDNNGKINVANANGSETAGVVKAGTNVTINDGVISVAAPGTGLNYTGLTGADFVANVTESNGVIEATAGNFHTVASTDNANTVSTVTVAPTTASIVSYVDTKFGIVDGNNTGLSTRLGTAEGAITNLQTLSGNNADAIEILNGDAETEGSVAAAAEAAKNAAIQDAAGKDATTGALGEVSVVANAADTLSKSNKTAIDKLDETYATDAEVTTAFSNYTTTHSDVLNSGITAAGVTQITTNKNNIETLGNNKQDKANANYQLGSNGSWINLADSMPASCKTADGVCTIVAKSGRLYWEVVAGGSTPEAEIEAVEVAAN